MRVDAIALVSCALAAVLAAPGSARAGFWDWLRWENGNVRDGNERLQAGDAKAALEAYDRAARELPSEGGVHLDRGLALLRSNQLGPAREAFRLANQPAAPAQVRADAAYNLGLTFYREADALAGEEKHDEAQKLFREAADAFKRALRIRPGDRNAAWNYELAKRRIQEQEEKQKQAQEQQKEQQKDQQNQPDAGQNDPSEPQNDGQEQAKQDGQQEPQEKPQGGQDSKQPEAQDKPQDQQAQNQPKPEAPKPDAPQPGQTDGQAPHEPKPSEAQPEVRPEVARALDALEDGEQNLERVRALNRAARERRKPEKDW